MGENFPWIIVTLGGGAVMAWLRNQFASIDRKFEKMDHKFEKMDHKFDRKFDELKTILISQRKYGSMGTTP